MNSDQLITNAEALRLFFNDDVYLVGDNGLAEAKTNKEHLQGLNTAADQEQGQPVIAERTPSPEATLPKVEEVVSTYHTALNFKYLGKNEKSILILVNDAQNPVSSPQGTELLRKLVLSINLKNADFALVNYAAYRTATFEQLQLFFRCKLVLSFGVSAKTLGLAEQALHKLNLFNEVKMIFTHNLHDLEIDIPAKKQLWATLKNL
ncbi:hypothetical protein [Pedobacter sp. UBA4863]|uniref:hypothetical protein n=1 Tax=Pedobacter sp. UBA4863 TaxID=1947060 RepID=UPI0025D50124|nr:hypothetical protein [Pedobacter sp. UBA4863]